MTRFEAICSLVDVNCDSLAEIACHRALVARYALALGVRNVIASDNSPTAVREAERGLAAYPEAHIICGDGFKGHPFEVEQAVIAGIGARAISGILKRAPYRPKTLILGPHSNAYRLVNYLEMSGYHLTHDIMVKERDKFYRIMRAEIGEVQYNDPERYFSIFYRTPDPTLKECIETALDTYLKDIPRISLLYPRREAALEVLKWQK